MKTTAHYYRALCAIFALALYSGGARSQTPPVVSKTPVEVQMRDVNLHLDQSTILEVRRLRGQMVATRSDRPVTFDDATSFITRIRTGEIAMAVSTLSDLLNQRVFAYPGAPVKNITVKAEKGKLKQTGTMHKGVNLPFELEGPIDATPSGEIRLHAEKVSSAHVPMKGLLHLFGEDLSKVINVRKDRGVSVEGDNILIQPGRLLPPPQIEGKVT